MVIFHSFLLVYQRVRRPSQAPFCPVAVHHYTPTRCHGCAAGPCRTLGPKFGTVLGISCPSWTVGPRYRKWPPKKNNIDIDRPSKNHHFLLETNLPTYLVGSMCRMVIDQFSRATAVQFLEEKAAWVPAKCAPKCYTFWWKTRGRYPNLVIRGPIVDHLDYHASSWMVYGVFRCSSTFREPLVSHYNFGGRVMRMIQTCETYQRKIPNMLKSIYGNAHLLGTVFNTSRHTHW